MPELFDDPFEDFEPDDGEPEFEELSSGDPDLHLDGFDPAFLEMLSRSPAARDPQLRWEELAALMEAGGAASLLQLRPGASPEMLMQQSWALEEEILAMEFELDDE